MEENAVLKELLIWVRILGTSGLIGIGYMALNLRAASVNIKNGQDSIKELWDHHNQLHENFYDCKSTKYTAHLPEK